MIIEVKEKGSKEYCKEVVNTMSQYKKLINRPDAELKDHFKSYPIWTGIMASLFTIWLCHGIFSGFIAIRSARIRAAKTSVRVFFSSEKAWRQ